MSARVVGESAEPAADGGTISTGLMGAFSAGLDVPLDRPGQRSSRRVHLVGMVLACLSGAIGAVVLVGYAVREEWIVEIAPSLPPMYPNAALALLAGALSVVGAQSHRRGLNAVAAAAACAVFSIGAIGLVLDVGGAGRTWFEALFPSGFVVATTPVGGRPVIASCLALMLVGSTRRLSAAASHDRLTLIR